MVVLAATLLGAASGALLLVGPMLFGRRNGLARARRPMIVMVALALVLLVVEWRSVH